MSHQQYTTIADVERLVTAGVPETTSLEFKEALPFTSRSERKETLKDVTGMANGGGGTIIYGVRESDDDFPIAAEITPLTDAGVVAQLEGVIRSAVRPPLLYQHYFIRTPTGFVLVVEVEPSPLGPYMVEAYENSGRFFTRIMTSTVPMTEHQVRDAYTLAARGRERRPALWQEHALPVRPATAAHPWLTISAVPEEPLRPLLDLATANMEAFYPPHPLRGHLIAGDLSAVVAQVRRWADGVFNDDSYDSRDASTVFRLHLDGAMGIAIRLRAQIYPIFVVRAMNGLLAYAGWLWQLLGLRRPVEIEWAIRQLDGATLHTGSMFAQDQPVSEPTGVPIHEVTLREHGLPHEPLDAALRHASVRRFADRLYQAFNLPRAEVLFRTGRLHGADGKATPLSIAGAGLWDGSGRSHGIVYEDGTVANRQNYAIGFVDEGAVLDRDGNVLAVLELSTSSACPRDFMATSLPDDPRATVPGGHPGSPHPTGQVMDALPVRPPPTRRWSDRTLMEALAL